MTNEKSSPFNISFDHWLDGMLYSEKRPDQFIDYSFPNDGVRDTFIAEAQHLEWSVIRCVLLSFLEFPPSMGCDDVMLKNLLTSEKIWRIEKNDFARRMVRPDIPTWNSLNWVLDLVDYRPRDAIAVIQAYVSAHAQELPDGRFLGLGDAAAIIRARYLEPLTAANLSENISSRDFELIIALLYHREGYKVEITSAADDGGFDVVATRQEYSFVERIAVECKLHNHPVGVQIARQLLGAWSDQPFTKFDLVTTSRFTRRAVELAQKTARLTLIDQQALSTKLNAAFGVTWKSKIDLLVAEARRLNDQ